MFGKKTLKTEETRIQNILVESVITNYYEYIAYLKKIEKELKSPYYSPLRIGNHFEINPIKAKRRTSKDKIKILADTLFRYRNAYSDVDKLNQYNENLKLYRQKLVESLDNLEHFYKHIKSKQKKKIKKFKGLVISAPIELPLLNLQGAKSHIDEFVKNQPDNFNQIEFLLKKDGNDQYILDDDGYYVVKKEFFTERIFKTIGNINTIINKQQKNFSKINRVHKNKTQLTNYLKF